MFSSRVHNSFKKIGILDAKFLARSFLLLKLWCNSKNVFNVFSTLYSLMQLDLVPNSLVLMNSGILKPCFNRDRIYYKPYFSQKSGDRITLDSTI